MKTSTFASPRAPARAKNFSPHIPWQVDINHLQFLQMLYSWVPRPTCESENLQSSSGHAVFQLPNLCCCQTKDLKTIFGEKVWKISKNLTGKKKYSLCVYSIVRWKVVECGANWDIDYSHRIHIDSHQVGGKQQKNIVRPSMPESQSLFPIISSLSAAINRFFPLLFLCVNKVWSYEAPLQE